MKKFIYHIEHTNGMDQNVWTSAENQYEAEQEIRHDYHSIKSLTLIKVEDMYLENGDEVIEADNGRLILANSGDEDGNPTGSVYHTDRGCASLKARNPKVEEILLSEARKKGYKPCKRCKHG